MKKRKVLSMLVVFGMIVLSLGLMACGPCPWWNPWCYPPPPPPTETPTVAPTDVPTEVPTEEPTVVPTEEPTVAPTEAPAEVEESVEEESTPVVTKCPTCGDPVWENMYGPINTGEGLYGPGIESLMIAWNGTFAKVEWTKPFRIVADGEVIDATLVKAIDGLDHYVIRGDFPNNFVIQDLNSVPWRQATGLQPWKFRHQCSIAPSFADTIFDGGGQMALGKFPGMNPSDVVIFLRLNGVDNSASYDWAYNVWDKQQIGEYAVLPDSFVPVLHE